MIQTIEDIQRLVKEGFTNWKEHGAVSVADVSKVNEAVVHNLKLADNAKDLATALQGANVSNLVFACTMNAFRNKPFKPLVLKHLKKGASSKWLIFGGEV